MKAKDHNSQATEQQMTVRVFLYVLGIALAVVLVLNFSLFLAGVPR